MSSSSSGGSLCLMNSECRSENNLLIKGHYVHSHSVSRLFKAYLHKVGRTCNSLWFKRFNSYWIHIFIGTDSITGWGYFRVYIQRNFRSSLPYHQNYVDTRYCKSDVLVFVITHFHVLNTKQSVGDIHVHETCNQPISRSMKIITQ